MPLGGSGKSGWLEIKWCTSAFGLADDVNVLGGSVHTIIRNAESLVVASKESGIEINADKTQYMVMFRYQNAGRSHNIKYDNISFERVVEFRYLGTTLTYKNSIHEEMKSKFNSGNICYHLCRIFFFSSLLSRNIKIKIYRTIILPVVLYGCVTWSLIVREERSLMVFENRVLRRIFGPKRNEVMGEWRKLDNKELNDLYSSPSIFRVIISRRMR